MSTFVLPEHAPVTHSYTVYSCTEQLAVTEVLSASEMHSVVCHMLIFLNKT